MGKKPIVSLTYENEMISIKNSLPYLKCVLLLSCVVHGPIYGRFMGFYVNGFLSIFFFLFPYYCIWASRFKRKFEEYNSFRGFTKRKQTRKRGSQWGGGFYSYRLKFWLFYGYRLITKKLKINLFCFKELNIKYIDLARAKSEAPINKFII